MVRKRARLTDDNDPLSSTDEVLAGFQQLSQSTSQPEDQSKSQKNNKLTRKQVDKSNSQEVQTSVKQEEVYNLTGQEVRLNSGQDQEKQLVNKSTSPLVELSGDKEMTSQPDNHKTSQKDEKSASEQVDKLTLRKVTFQIQESVVNRLDKLHLQLQLDLGKTNAPYKEVIVEEAISRLLEEMESNREELLEVLQKRQSQRK